jgi:hypothetical protein
MIDELKKTKKEAIKATKYYPRIFLEGLKKTTQTSVRIGDVRP